MNHLKLDNEGGLLAFQEVLAFMQSSYTNAVDDLCRVVGNNVIITGCEVVAGNITDGTLILNGEILPFVGGVNGGFIQVTETIANAPYIIGGDKPFYYERKAEPSSSGVPLSSFFRLGSLHQHYTNTNNPHQVTKAQVGLGDLPNAKSDSITLDDSNVLATAKAIYFLNHSKIVTGTSIVGDIESGGNVLQTITHNAGTTDYRGFISNASLVDYYGITKLFYTIVEKNANNFKVRISVLGGNFNNVKLDWMLVKY